MCANVDGQTQLAAQYAWLKAQLFDHHRRRKHAREHERHEQTYEIVRAHVQVDSHLALFDVKKQMHTYKRIVALEVEHRYKAQVHEIALYIRPALLVGQHRPFGLRELDSPLNLFYFDTITFNRAQLTNFLHIIINKLFLLFFCCFWLFSSRYIYFNLWMQKQKQRNSNQPNINIKTIRQILSFD